VKSESEIVDKKDDRKMNEAKEDPTLERKNDDGT